MAIAQNAGLTQFDPEALLRTVEGDEALARELCVLFIQQCHADLAAIGDEIKKGESDALGRALHRLKGASLAVCANRLAVIADEFGNIVKEGGWQSSLEMWTALQESAEEAVTAMHSYIGADDTTV